MAELNLQQIIQKLNAAFADESRRLVFWYDEKGEFAEDMDSLQLENAKVYRLTQDNQFKTKYFLERQDRTTNYLIYAPFPKPDVSENHLEDMLLYSKRFYADRASLLMVDLGIEEQYRPVIEKHIAFFSNKTRTQRFYDLELEGYDEDKIEVGCMSVLCRSRVCSFEEVVRIVLTEEADGRSAGRITAAEDASQNAPEQGTAAEDASQNAPERGTAADDTAGENMYLKEFARYDLTGAFWRLCAQHYGYAESNPSLGRFLLTLFVTSAEKTMTADLPAAWEPFVSGKSGNVLAFLNSMMNSVLYRERFDELSRRAAQSLNLTKVLREMAPEDLTDCDLFEEIDRKLILWMTERLVNEDLGARLNGRSIPEICEKRRKMHFGGQYADAYQMLDNACYLIGQANYTCPEDHAALIQQYTKRDYQIDRAYRYFYLHLDRLEEAEAFEELRELVERIYANEYLAELLPRWNGVDPVAEAPDLLLQQRSFYMHKIAGKRDQIVVIISDALRYEAGAQLQERLKDDPKCTSVKLSAMQSTLPSYTRLGMAALLPHRTLSMTDDFDVLADGVLCNDLEGRQTVLQRYQKDGVCVQFDDVKGLNKNDLRSVFTKRPVVYIYHNQIDARGDKPNTEDEVFAACEEAVEEIMALMHRLNANANRTYFIVTADHGFLYRRDKLEEKDKIAGVKAGAAAGRGPADGVRGQGVYMNRRFVISDEPLQMEGVGSIRLGETLGGDDGRAVSFPIGADVFKLPGGGMNYVHGGSSPQEMLIPLLEIRMERRKVETTTTQIAMVSILNKITNLITQIDFIQSDAVSDTVRGTTYRLYFISDAGERISNELTYVADKRDVDAGRRVFRLKFTFKNRQYSRSVKYYLVVMDDNTGVEAWRHEVTVDMAFAGDFEFGF